MGGVDTTKEVNNCTVREGVAAFLSPFGVPRTFMCDNETQFTSRAFQSFCERLGMELEHTAPYRTAKASSKHCSIETKTTQVNPAYTPQPSETKQTSKSKAMENASRLPKRIRQQQVKEWLHE